MKKSIKEGVSGSLMRFLKYTENKKTYQSVFLTALGIDLTPDAYSFPTILALLLSSM